MFVKLTGKGNWLTWVVTAGVLYVFSVFIVGIGWGVFSWLLSGTSAPSITKIFLGGLFVLPITLVFRKVPLACLRFFFQWLPVNFSDRKSQTTIHYNRMENLSHSESFSPAKKRSVSTKNRQNYQPDETPFFAEEEKEVWNRLLNEPNLEEKELLHQAKLFLAKKKKKKDNPPG